ncbi:MAG: methylase domain protein [Variovorax sp.]|nr:methylase domain protein [Variovorax sp.]
MAVQILVGDCRTTLARLAERTFHTCVTSPPYWGLRDYGTEPLEWPAIAYAPLAGLPACVDVPAMTCSLGLEPTLEAFIGHMVLVFREVRRVLRDDGTLWVNMGDSYAGSRRGAGYVGEPSESLAGPQTTHSRAAKQKLTASRRRDAQPVPRSDVCVAGLKAKDLVGQPWRLALALQADGWWLRSDVIWHKPNPMPESTKDRPTKAHEYVFLLAKSERYFYDANAIKEPASEDTHARYARGRSDTHKHDERAQLVPGQRQQTISKSFEHMRKPVAGWATRGGSHSTIEHAQADATRPAKLLHNPKAAPADSGIKANESFQAATAHVLEDRNKRSVWTVATEGYKDAHFATFPTKLIEPCILAGTSAKGCCPACGAPWSRLTAVSYSNPGNRTTNGARSTENREITAGFKQRLEKSVETLGWEQGCLCEAAPPVPCRVLDCFGGSGTTGLVSDRLGCDAVLCELSPSYAAMGDRRIAGDRGHVARQRGMDLDEAHG